MPISTCHSTMTIMNSWEAHALQYNFQQYDGDDTAELTAEAAVATAIATHPKDSIHDPVIYPGIYAPSGFDMMNILIRIISRPDPTIQLGPVDASCALLMCDIEQADYPVVYANDACTELTGYSNSEMMGRNCRFMQAPGGRVKKSSAREHVERSLIRKMNRAIEANREIAVEIPNFKKNGDQFINLLTMIPVCWDSQEPRYYVGFMAEKTW
ncbi:vivid PAS protein VVD [Xylariaceae sp. FL1272]|nr:vivid PAS protein VVD [Xylariaceae sp. FL1272]